MSAKTKQPFPFIGHGFAAARKSMIVFIAFEGDVPATSRKRIARGLPQSFDGQHWTKRTLTVAHDSDSLQWAVCAEYAEADPDYFGEVASEPQWRAFNEAFDDWLLGVHKIAPVALVLRPIDDEYGTDTDDWHDWSVARVPELVKIKGLPAWAREELEAAEPAPKPKRSTAKKDKTAKATKKESAPQKTRAKPATAIRDGLFELTYLAEPLIDAMDYHRARGEPDKEAIAFWGGVLFFSRTLPNLIDRERSKRLGKPPANAVHLFAQWLKDWLDEKLAHPSALSDDKARRWLRWCFTIQSPVLDDVHAALEADVLKRTFGDKPRRTEQGYCPFCGGPFELTYAGTDLGAARCVTTNARMAPNAGDYLKRNMFDAEPTGTAFNAMSALDPNWFCARCGSKHRSRKTKDGTFSIPLQCPKCKHGYTVGLLDGLTESMADRHRRHEQNSN